MILRSFKPTDRGWIIARHRALYAKEFGFTPDFGDSIAEKLDAFLAREDPVKRLWIAEEAGQRIGSIALSDRDGAAFLNFVLLEPAARGRGLGNRLVQTALAHARSIHLGSRQCRGGPHQDDAVYASVLSRIAP